MDTTSDHRRDHRHPGTERQRGRPCLRVRARRDHGQADGRQRPRSRRVRSPTPSGCRGRRSARRCCASRPRASCACSPSVARSCCPSPRRRWPTCSRPAGWSRRSPLARSSPTAPSGRSSPRCTVHIDEMRTAAKQRDTTAYVEADRAFHLELVAAAGQRDPHALYRSLRDRQLRMGVVNLLADGRAWPTRRGCATPPTSTSGSPTRSRRGACAPRSTPRSASTSTTPASSWRGGDDDCYDLVDCVSQHPTCPTRRRSRLGASARPSRCAGRFAGRAVYVTAVFHRSSLGVAGLDAADRFGISAGAAQRVRAAAARRVRGDAGADRHPRRPLRAAPPAARRRVTMAVAQLLFAIAPSYPTALAARALLGCGDALTFVSVLRFAAQHFSARRYPVVVALTGTLGAVGNIVATMPLSACARLDRLDAELRCWPRRRRSSSRRSPCGAACPPPAGARRAGSLAPPAGPSWARRRAGAAQRRRGVGHLGHPRRLLAALLDDVVHHDVRRAVGRAVPRGAGVLPRLGERRADGQRRRRRRAQPARRRRLRSPSCRPRSVRPRRRLHHRRPVGRRWCSASAATRRKGC